MTKFKKLVTASLAATLMAGTSSAQMVGLYTRAGENGPETITVHIDGGNLYCTRNSDGFEMCHGLVLSDDNRWRGRTMKHPDMPRFMTFNGTASFSETQMNLRGCAMGICDAETWDKQ